MPVDASAITPDAPQSIRRQSRNTALPLPSVSESPTAQTSRKSPSRAKQYDRYPLSDGPDSPRRIAARTPDKPLSTPSKAAYAAPTFSASPAPSALPIPKLLSRSVPEPVAQGSFQARLAEESSQETRAPMGRDRSHLEDERRESQGSPLDIFFKADREEKARAQSETRMRTLVFNKIEPRALADGGRPSTPSPRTAPMHARRSKLADTNGESGGEGPGYSGPGPSRVERMPAVRSHTVPAAAHEDEGERRRAQSQALKDLLGINGCLSGSPPGASPGGGNL